MLPLRLTIQGLYSYQAAQVIDFAQLTAAGLFGIFGQVGSGKSSILEAIGFALYGKTERLGEKENRNYNMMNLRSDELLIDFEFENYDGALYRFVVSGKRNRKTFEEVKTLPRRAFRWQDGDWQPLASADATEILDLSYDNFRRTIIIPQGKFQEFLQLGSKDRTQMMMEIFKLHRYDLSSNVSRLESENNLAISNLEGQLSQFEDKTPERLAALEADANQLSGEWKSQNELLHQKNDLLRQLSQLKEKFVLFTTAENNLKTLLSEEPAFNERYRQLAVYESARDLFGLHLNRYDDYDANIGEKKKAVQDWERKIATLNQGFGTLAKELETVAVDYNKLEHFRHLLSDYTQAAIYIKEQQAYKEKNIAIAKGEELLQQENENRNAIVRKITSLQSSIQDEKSNLKDSFVLGEIDKWFLQKNTFQQQLSKLNDEVSQQKTAIANLQQSFARLGLRTDDFEDILHRERQKIKEQKEALIATLQALNVQSELQQYAHRLEDGKPCPLCGALEHPDILQQADLAHAIATENEALLQLDADADALEAKRREALQLYMSLQSYMTQSHEKSEGIRELYSKLESHLQSFAWNEFDPNDEHTFETIKAQTQKLTVTIRLHEQELEILKNEQQKVGDKIHLYEKTLTERTAQKEAALQNIQNALQQLKVLTEKDIASHSIDTIAVEKDNMERKIRDTASRYEQLQQQYQQRQQELTAARASLDALSQDISTLQHTLDSIAQQLQESLQGSGFQTLDAVRHLLHTTIDTVSERNAIEVFRQKLFAQRQQFLALQTELQGLVFDPLVYQQLEMEVNALAQNAELLKSRLDIINNNIQTLIADLQRKKNLSVQLHQLQLRAEDIKTLKNLFAGSGFVNYVSSVYLQNLCNAANERFLRLTRNQLRLELNERNEFWVQDLINGGRTRSVKTLSGGQTFQASLSLALALADSVQSQNKAGQNFFFLDEGFGSLDKESLGTVFETLKALRRENRIVGIISHVEDLQQEIPISLLIHNDLETGSKIEQVRG